MLLHATNDVQLCGYVFGEWRYVFIVYVVMEVQSHFWDNVDRLFQVESKCYIGCLRYFKNPTR
jgi:phage-related holin